MKGNERALFRKIANGIDVSLYIGKDGITDALVAQAENDISAKELIKVSVQKNCEDDIRELCHELSRRLGAEEIQVIGRKFSLYRFNPENKNHIV